MEDYTNKKKNKDLDKIGKLLERDSTRVRKGNKLIFDHNISKL